MTGPTILKSLAILLPITLLVGCGGGGGIDLTDVSGTATFDGSPIVFGQIEFNPQDSTAPPGFADIIDGKYDTAAEGGRGIVPGAHEIRVSAYSAKPVERPEGETADETVIDDPSAPKAVFLGYTTQGELDGTSFDINVPADAAGGAK